MGAKKADIEKFSKMSASELEAAIKEKSDAMEKLETDFKAFVEGLQKQYSDASVKKEKDVEEIKNSGLGLMKAVAAHLRHLLSWVDLPFSVGFSTAHDAPMYTP